MYCNQDKTQCSLLAQKKCPEMVCDWAFEGNGGNAQSNNLR